MTSDNNSISRKTKLEDKDYKWGFTTDVETEVVPKGLSEEIIKIIPVLIILKTTKFINEPIDYIIYSSISALGFAFIENIQYIY